MMGFAVVALAVVSLLAGVVRADEPVPGSPPDFDAYFQSDRAASTRLSGWSLRREQAGIPGAELAAMVRAGFRNFGGDRAELLRWIARREIAGRSNPDEGLVALMYHAAGIPESAPDGAAVRHAAIHAGLANVRPLPAHVLQFLVDFSLDSDRPEDLSRVAWAIEEQRPEAERWLEVRTGAGGPEVQEKAGALLQIWRGKLNVHVWARQRGQAERAGSFQAESPGILWALAAGDSAARREALKKIEDGRWMAFMGAEHLPAFIECATDSAADVRAHVARLAAEHWIHQAARQEPDVVALVFRLSADPDPEVRHHAVFNGLSTVLEKDEALLVRLLEVLGRDAAPELRDRIARGIGPYGTQVDAILEAWRKSRSPERRELARVVISRLAE